MPAKLTEGSSGSDVAQKPAHAPFHSNAKPAVVDTVADDKTSKDSGVFDPKHTAHVCTLAHVPILAIGTSVHSCNKSRKLYRVSGGAVKYVVYVVLYSCCCRSSRALLHLHYCGVNERASLMLCMLL